MKKGLVIGKFYPFHAGHEYLIRVAQEGSDALTVIVCDDTRQTIRGNVRAGWIRSVFPDVNVLVLPDVVSSDDSLGWARYTVQALGYIPDIVFTSEDYGDAYARAMGSKHKKVDKARLHVPISSTKIREDMQSFSQYLPRVVRSYFVKRIAIVGAESTGTTTLAQDLAAYFKTVWVPEVGRYFSEGKRFGSERDVWRREELSWINVFGKEISHTR